MILETISYLTSQIPPTIGIHLFILIGFLFAFVLLGGIIYLTIHENAKSYQAFYTAYFGLFCGSWCASIIINCIQEMGITILPYPITMPDILIIGTLCAAALYGATLIYNKKHWGQYYPWYYITEKRK